MKKLLGIGMVLVMIMTLFACGSGNNLSNQIENLQAKLENLDAELADLQDEKAEMENWIEEFNNEKKALDNKIYEMEIEIKILKNEPFGDYFPLEQAYEVGYLTQEDLKSIAYYQNGGRTGNEQIMDENYVPMPKTPATLDAKTERSIKETIAYFYRNSDKDPVPDAKAAYVNIMSYYGCYNGIVAFIYDSAYGGDLPGVEIEATIGGVYFCYPNSRTIMAWKKL